MTFTTFLIIEWDVASTFFSMLKQQSKQLVEVRKKEDMDVMYLIFGVCVRLTMSDLQGASDLADFCLANTVSYAMNCTK